VGKRRNNITVLRRIFAWLALAGFIFLIIDILYLGWINEASSFIYILLAVLFILSSVLKKRAGITDDTQTVETGEDDGGSDRPEEDYSRSGKPKEGDINSGEPGEAESYSGETIEDDGDIDEPIQDNDFCR
jgi:hypothetical protein